VAEPHLISFRGKFPQAPKHLKATGKAMWQSGASLWADGTLLQRDLPQWALYCEAWDEKQSCEAAIANEGQFQLLKNGCKVAHPAIKLRQSAERTIRFYATAFGLIPDARKKRPAVQQGVIARKKP
jgi:P27 family predicted phage terminase small subunit